MPSSKSVRPPWWLKPANKVFIQMSRLLRAFPTEVPTGVGFMKRSGLVTEGMPEEFEALAGRCAVFRLVPV
jgi:hypothetical protein